MDQQSVLSSNNGLESLHHRRQLQQDLQDCSEENSKDAFSSSDGKSQSQLNGARVTSIYANTYSNAFSLKEIEVLQKFSQKKGLAHFNKMQRKLYQQCGNRHLSRHIRREWRRIIKRLNPSKDHILQYIKGMIKHGWIKYETIANHLVDSPFQNALVARQFLKRIYIKTMKAVEDFVAKYFFRNVERLSHQDKKTIGKLLTVGIGDQKNLRPSILRFFLLSIYVQKLKGIKTAKSDVMTTYSMMSLVKQQYLTHQMEINCRGTLGYAWSIQQLRQLFQLYIQNGFQFRKISKQMCMAHGEHKKYTHTSLLSCYARLIRQAFFMSIKNRQDYVFSYRLTVRQVRILLLTKQHPQFPLMVKLVSVFFGQEYPKQQMNQIYEFIGRILEERAQYKKKGIKKQKEKIKKIRRK